jgi:hypothetical protein
MARGQLAKTFGVAHIPARVTIASYTLLVLHARGTIGPDRPAQLPSVGEDPASPVTGRAGPPA